MFPHSLRSFLTYLLLLIAPATLLIGCSSSRKIAAGTGKKTDNAKPSSLSDRELRNKYAARIQASPKDIDNIPLYRFIEEWYGTPYRYGGNGKKGVDCSGFTTNLYTTVYNTAIQRTAQLQYDASRKVKKKKLREGDFVFFRDGGKKITHVGIYLMNHFFVHASTGNGVMISNLDEAYWEDHFAGGGKIK